MRTGSPFCSPTGDYNGTQTENGTGNHEYSHGKILVVGLGPGGREHLSPRALSAIEEAQVIVGYKTYLGFIDDLLPGKEVVGSGMRKEVERARMALDLAENGKVVAVVSSGDPGVYGMAGLVLEIAGARVPVEVVPGVTAATSAAAILGAPLMHDFAVISLSDLLTPWETISRRITAAAQADFVIVFYNPRSRGREKQIEIARDILLNNKDAATPVGIVQNALRNGENLCLTTLANMLENEINMQSTVIVGNSQTRIENGRMLTPRGYGL